MSEQAVLYDQAAEQREPLLSADQSEQSSLLPEVPEAPQVQQGAELPKPDEEPSPQKPKSLEESPIATRPQMSTASEELVTIPIMKLQQLVEFCAQIVRESRGLKPADSDPETAMRPTEISVRPYPATEGGKYVFTEEHLAQNHWARYTSWGAETKVEAKQEIEKIWAQVTASGIDIFAAAEEEDSDSWEARLRKKCRTLEDLHLLFIDKASRDPVTRTLLGEFFAYSIKNAQNQRVLRADEREDPLNFELLVAVGVYGARSETLGHILRSCYSCGALKQPVDRNLAIYLQQLVMVAKYAFMFNRIFNLYESFNCFARLGDRTLKWGFLPFSAMWNDYMIGNVFIERSLDQVMGISTSQVPRLLQLTCSPDQDDILDSAEGRIFQVDDLNIKSLQSFGGLQIVWTLILEEHLLLDLDNMISRVLWESPGTGDPRSVMSEWDNKFFEATPEGFCGRVKHRSLEFTALGVYREVRKTWAILFATDNNLKNREEDYKNFCDLNRVKQGMAYTELAGSEWTRREHFDGEAGFEFTSELYTSVLEAALKKDPLSYSQFRFFETRLRQLRHHMNQRKPRGIRQLWKDKRDTLSYYTFWGVIIFGTFSVFLALLSLVIGVAQTVASFESLAESRKDSPAT